MDSLRSGRGMKSGKTISYLLSERLVLNCCIGVWMFPRVDQYPVPFSGCVGFLLLGDGAGGAVGEGDGREQFGI